MEHKIFFQINGGKQKEFAECSDSFNMEHKIFFQINGGKQKEFAECSDSFFSLALLLPTAEQYEQAKESGATLSQVVFTDESGNSFRLFSEPKT